MEEKRILSKPKFLLWFTLIFAILSVVYAIFEFVKLQDALGASIRLLTGFVFLFQFLYLIRYNKYFIRYGDGKIEWFLLGMDKPTTVSKSDILSFHSDWKGIEIKTNQNEYSISFKEYEWSQGKLIRESFNDFTS